MNSIIQTPVANLETSLSYYTSLGFEILRKENPIVLTEGSFLLEINPERFARPGIKLYADSWNDELKAIDSPKYTKENVHVITDPNGVWINLVEGKSPVSDFKPSDSKSVIGNFAGLSIETLDMAASRKFWESIGFKLGMGDETKSWMVLTNSDNFGVSIMMAGNCPHLFIKPSLTFFNSGKNPEIISKIRNLNIPIFEEITHFNPNGEVDNIIIQDPGGLGMFVFND